MTAAAAVTFVLGVTLGLSQSFWAVIAAVVATQGSLGGTLKASFEQFIGSVFGAGLGWRHHHCDPSSDALDA